MNNSSVEFGFSDPEKPNLSEQVLVQGGDDNNSLHCNERLSESDILFARNWPLSKKLFVTGTSLSVCFNTNLSSGLTSGASSSLLSAFKVTDQTQFALPISVYLIGYIFGPLVFGPMSESFGRRPCFLTSFGLYTLGTLGCCLAPNWPALLIFRFLVGVGASAPQYILGGVYSDLYSDLTSRGRAMMVAGLLNNFAPLLGPVVAGYTSATNWRWMFWIALILAGANWPLLLFYPETFPPTIRRRLGKSSRIVDAPSGTAHMKDLVLISLTRPIRMFTEPLVLFSDMILVYQYSIFYLFFEAYPIIFRGTYNMTEGQSALTLLPIGIGAFFAMFIFFWYDYYLAKSKIAGKKWALLEEYRRLPLLCVGGPLYAISLFWLGWTTSPSIHWMVPCSSGLVYGIGIDLSFMALNNYITDAYGIYAASALASSVLSRNIAAALLITLGSYPMYEKLGVNWACSLLGFVCVALIPIPFVFIKYGPLLRKRSPFCQKLAEHGDMTEQNDGSKVL